MSHALDGEPPSMHSSGRWAWERTTLDAFLRKVDDEGQRCATVLAISDWGPDAAAERAQYLPVKKGMHFVVKRSSTTGWWFGFDAANESRGSGWCPDSHFIIWRVIEEGRLILQVPPTRRDQFLNVNVGDDVHMKKQWTEGDWQGWGYGEKVGSSEVGLIRMARCAPSVFLKLTRARVLG